MCPLIQCLTKFAQMHSNPQEEREGEKETSRVCKNCFMKIEVIGEQATKIQTDEERWGGRWWQVDLWAAGLFINHTEFYWNRERRRERETDIEWEGAGRQDQWREIKFRGVMLWYHSSFWNLFRHCPFPYLSIFSILWFQSQPQTTYCRSYLDFSGNRGRTRTTLALFLWHSCRLQTCHHQSV